MYEICKDRQRLSVEDKARYVKLQRNGTYRLCDESEAHGVVVNNEYICHLAGKPPLEGLDTVTITEINGSLMVAEAQAAVDELLDAIGGAA